MNRYINMILSDVVRLAAQYAEHPYGSDERHRLYVHALQPAVSAYIRLYPSADLGTLDTTNAHRALLAAGLVRIAPHFAKHSNCNER